EPGVVSGAIGYRPANDTRRCRLPWALPTIASFTQGFRLHQRRADRALGALRHALLDLPHSGCRKRAIVRLILGQNPRSEVTQRLVDGLSFVDPQVLRQAFRRPAGYSGRAINRAVAKSD